MSLVVLALALQGVTLSGSDAPHHANAAARVPVECSAFKANANGSWTSTHQTTVGKVSLSAGGTVFPGVTLNGVDLGAQLNQQCRGAGVK